MLFHEPFLNETLVVCTSTYEIPYLMMKSSNFSFSATIFFTLLPSGLIFVGLCLVVNEELKNMINGLPLFLEGKVCKGFGRGSKDLGCPTANFDDNVEKLLPKEILSGVYFGWAQVEEGPVYKMVMSIGWNPFFKNEKRSIETHILHEFPQDFYDSNLKVVVLDYIRPEMNFSSIDELMKEINNDITVGKEKLNEQRYRAYQNHEFFNLSLSNREEKDGHKNSVNGVQAKI